MSLKLAPLALVGFMLAGCSSAPSATADEPIVAGSTTRGGVTEGTEVIHVTSLSDSGPGTLRAAVEANGARVIVFDIGGRINLTSDLIVRHPYITIAGQTAPSPGISLWDASFRIRTHDVIVQHIAVRTGPSSSRKKNDNRDSISIDGNPRGNDGKNASYEVLLENVSASWSVDEALSLWYKTTQHITIRSSIVAEALNKAGHPKGEHSMGLLIGTNTGPAEVTGNLLASNKFRNPVMGRGSTSYVANNYVVNPGWNAIHFYTKGPGGVSKTTIMNNVVEAGPSSQPKLHAVSIPAGPATVEDLIYVDGNEALGFHPEMHLLGHPLDMDLSQEPPVVAPDWKLMPTSEVKDWVLRYAGTRPADRDPVDKRLLQQIAAGEERILDQPTDAGPIPEIHEKRHVAEVPSDPLGILRDTGKTRLEAWLCLEHLELGGPPSQECSQTPDALKAALGEK